MATIKEWKKEVEKLGDTDLKELKEALDNLSTWKFFDSQFEWTLYKSIRCMIQAEIEKRTVLA